MLLNLLGCDFVIYYDLMSLGVNLTFSSRQNTLKYGTKKAKIEAITKKQIFSLNYSLELLKFIKHAIKISTMRAIAKIETLQDLILLVFIFWLKM